LALAPHGPARWLPAPRRIPTAEYARANLAVAQMRTSVRVKETPVVASVTTQRTRVPDFRAARIVPKERGVATLLEVLAFDGEVFS
jgi:hypothetical protein